MARTRPDLVYIMFTWASNLDNRIHIARRRGSRAGTGQHVVSSPASVSFFLALKWVPQPNVVPYD